MSTQMMIEAQKKAAQTIIPSRSLAQQYHPPFAEQTENAAPSPGLTEPGLGHDLSQVSIHAATIPTGSGATQPVAQSCPLTMGHRACPFGGACHTCPTSVQAKLAVGQPRDPFEQEADQIAGRVMRMPENHVLQRKCSSCSTDEDDDVLQAKELPGQTPSSTLQSGVPPIVHQVLNSPGQPLDPVTRAFMEPRFGYDFSPVKVHTDARAAESARAAKALAYTVGQDIVFGAGQYSLSSEAGKRLLAHELTHVIQQSDKTVHAHPSLQPISRLGMHQQNAIQQRITHTIDQDMFIQRWHIENGRKEDSVTSIL